MAGLHLLAGLATIACAFPFVSFDRRRELIRRWSSRLLRIFGVRCEVEGPVSEPTERGLVLVANHTAWLDIFVIHSIQPARFVAKAELARWPLIGWLIRGVGTLFIDRSSRRHLHAAGSAVNAALGHGHVIALFPEGQVTDGTLHRFHGSMLQPAIERDAPLQALAIRYEDEVGVRTAAPVYADLNFLQSLWRVTGARRIVARVTAFPVMHCEGHDRRSLAATAEALIRRRLA